MMDEALYSRSPSPSRFGKCENRMAIPVPELLDRVAVLLGSMQSPRPMPKAEYIRSILERILLGEFACLRAKMAQPNADPLAPPVVSLDEALESLAMVAGMSRNAFETMILSRVVFGEVSMLRSVDGEFPFGNATNVPLSETV